MWFADDDVDGRCVNVFGLACVTSAAVMEKPGVTTWNQQPPVALSGWYGLL